jgi:hypothetical protein
MVTHEKHQDTEPQHTCEEEIKAKLYANGIISSRNGNKQHYHRCFQQQEQLFKHVLSPSRHLRKLLCNLPGLLIQQLSSKGYTCII